jgi:hypothetical protein
MNEEKGGSAVVLSSSKVAEFREDGADLLKLENKLAGGFCCVWVEEGTN